MLLANKLLNVKSTYRLSVSDLEVFKARDRLDLRNTDVEF